jgi:phage antirepressor YoqD-like protein
MDSGAILGYAAMPYTHKQNNQVYFEYFVSKRDSYVIVAQMSPAFTAALVDRWQELEEQQKPIVPQTYAAALLEAGRLALEVEKQAEQLKLAAPKVEFVDRFTQRENLQNATQVAQTMKMSAVAMNKHLDVIGGVYSKAVKRSRAFLQDWIDKGYGVMNQNEIGHPQALFTTLGVTKITEIFISEGII